jgi:hypothetical protein
LKTGYDVLARFDVGFFAGREKEGEDCAVVNGMFGAAEGQAAVVV